MKRISSLVVALLISCMCFCQVVSVISNTDNTITVRKTKVYYDTYKKVSSTDYDEYTSKEKNGRVGIALGSGYNFINSIEWGGHIFYNFSGKVDGKVGITGGFDYGMNQWWREPGYGMNYWHTNVGVTLLKYIGVSYVFGKVTGYDTFDHGVKTSLYLPFGKYFGLQAYGKWTKDTYFTAGGGLIFMIPIAAN